MKTRALVALTAVAGFAMAAQAQDTLTWTWSWVHVDAANPTQTIMPQQAGVLSPGNGTLPDEAAEIRGSFSFTPDIGTIRTSQVTNQSGPVAGIANSNIDLHALAGHNGTFHTTIHRFPATGTPPVVLNDEVRGIVVGVRSSIFGPIIITATQFNNAVRIRWIPNDYVARDVAFQAQKNINTPTTGATLFVNVGGLAPGTEIYASYQIALDPGGQLTVPVIPSPSSLALLGLGGIVATRRHRRPRTHAVAEQALLSGVEIRRSLLEE